MTSVDFFGYQIGDDGRLTLPGLTKEETLEFELLTRRDRDLGDRSSEMRELELYLKQHKAIAAQGRDFQGGDLQGRGFEVDAPTAPLKIVPTAFEPRARYDHSARLSNRTALATIAILSLMGAGLVTMLFLFAGSL